MSDPLRRMPLAALVVGIALVAGALLAGANTRRRERRESADIRQLQAFLDSARAALARAPSAGDSARLAEEVTSREHFLGRRAYHLAGLQATALGWWQPAGTGTLLVAQGALLITVGSGVLVRRRRTSSS